MLVFKLLENGVDSDQYRRASSRLKREEPYFPLRVLQRRKWSRRERNVRRVFDHNKTVWKHNLWAEEQYVESKSWHCNTDYNPFLWSRAFVQKRLRFSKESYVDQLAQSLQRETKSLLNIIAVDVEKIVCLWWVR